MLPTKSDVHINRPLTNISIALMQNRSNFVAAEVFPIVPVQKQSDIFWSYDNAYWNRDEMMPRAPATESHGGGYDIGQGTYYAKVWAIHKDIPDQILANADSPIDLERGATEWVTLKALIRREKLFATAFMGGGIWTRDYDGVASAPGANQMLQWNDASSTPIEDIWAAKADVLERTGFEPNTLVLGYRVLNSLINHPDFIDRVKYGNTTGIAMIDQSDLAQVFKVDRVVIMKAIENTANEGATKSHSFIGGGKQVLLTYRPPSPGLMAASSGYIFSWVGLTGAGPDGQRIKRFRMEPIASERVELEMAFDMKLISADLGAFFDTVVA